MKKKHLIWGMMTIMMVVAVSFVIASCSKDSSSSGGGGTTANVIGTWRGEEDDDILTLVFNTNGEGTWQMKDYDHYYQTYDIESGTFSYIMSDSSKGKMYVEGEIGYYTGVFEVPFEINGNKMFIYDEDYYGYNEIEWILTKQ